MSLPKKKSRKVTVEGIQYRWLLARYPESISGWRTDTGMLTNAYRETLNQYRNLMLGNLLGEVTDLTRNVFIELSDGPHSKLIVKYSYLVFDGFSGVEPFEPITNKTVAGFIKESLKAGWDPHKKGEFKIEKFQDQKELKERLKKKEN